MTSAAPLPVWPQIKRQRLEVEAARTHSDGVVKSANGVSGLEDGAWLRLDDVDFGPGWQSAVLRIESNVKEMNSDGSARVKPRHTKATDPLAMEAIVNDGTQEQIRRQWTFLYFSYTTWERTAVLRNKRPS